MKLLPTIFICFLTVFAFAQDPELKTANQTDLEAKSILEKVKKKVQEFEAFQIRFSLDINFPEEEPVNYSGDIQQQSDAYKIDVKDYLILCDGKTRWIYNRADNLVQIYEATSGDDSFSSPLDLIKKYTTDDFAFALMGTNDNSMHIMEFKPLDRYSEFSKIRTTISTDFYLKKLEIFEKNGAKSIFEIHEQKEIAPLPGSEFLFNAALYPDVLIEDLRLD